MKISEYIKHLQTIQEQEGDLEVQKYAPDASRQSAREPHVAHALILKGRERKPRFYAGYEGEELQGEKVVRI